MFKIITLLADLNPVLNYTLRRQLAGIAEAMLAMSGRVTMLGLSRWTSQGGSYRTIQRFFQTQLNWPLIRWLFIRQHLPEVNDTIIIARDEVNVTQSGKKTYGIGRLFSSLSDKTVPSIYFLSLSLLSVKNHRSFSIMMEQVMPEIVKSSSKTTTRNDSCHRRKRGRPLGSNNQNRVVVELSKYLQLGQATVKSLLKLVNTEINLVYLVFDGAFGNHNALQMVRQGGLQLISTMRYDSALYFPYRGKYCGRGRRSKYGNRLNCRAIPN